MKRFLSILLASLMVLTLAVALVVPTSAALEGDWVTSRSADDYEDDGSYCPAPGYHYDPALGFVIDPPEYAPDNTPFIQAHLKNPVDIKANNDGNGYSVNLKFTVLEYAYDGGENKDQWIYLNLSSGNMSAPPSNEYGEGICILMRGQGYGSTQAQPFYIDKESNWGQVVPSFPAIEVPMNDQDQEVYTFTVKYVDGVYTFAINGYEFVGDDKMNAHFDEVFANGCYVNICAQTGVKDSKISLAINEWQGNLPVGDDSLAPEEDLRAKAPIAPSENIPANEPAVLWDSTERDFRKISVAGGVYEINEDGSVHITAQTASPYVSFGIKSDISYEAKDFPYIAVLTRNCWANSGNVFYCAGGILAAENTYSETWDLVDTEYPEGWTLGLIDFSEYNDDDPDYEAGWEGRINSIRIGFDFNADDVTDETYNNFDLAFIGAFRSPDEAKAFTEAWLAAKGYSADQVTTEEPTTEEPTTEAPTTEAPTTEAPAGSDAEVTTDATEEPTKGCKALVAMPVVALVAMLGVAFVAKKKD